MTEDQPTAPKPQARVRSTAALVLIVIGVVLAPVALIGGWARLQLVDTDRFVQTFAPLAEKPEVQQLVVDGIVQGIEQQLDIDSLVDDAFSGISALGLPARSEAAFRLLQGPASEGARSLIASGVERVVESPRFAGLWEAALCQSHARMVSVIQGDPDSVLQLSDEGVLSISLAVVSRDVQQSLEDQGIRFAALIPEVDRSITILSSESLVPVRGFYLLAASLGFWLPWIALGALVAGVLLAHDRLRALTRTGLGLVAAFAVLAAAILVGRAIFIGRTSPALMPAETAGVMFDQLTGLIWTVLLVLGVLSLFAAVGGLVAGSERFSGRRPQ